MKVPADIRIVQLAESAEEVPGLFFYQYDLHSEPLKNCMNETNFVYLFVMLVLANILLLVSALKVRIKERKLKRKVSEIDK